MLIKKCFAVWQCAVSLLLWRGTSFGYRWWRDVSMQLDIGTALFSRLQQCHTKLRYQMAVIFS
jgi:hypothetical protein